MRQLPFAGLVLAFAVSAPPALSQSNVVPGRDLQLFSLNGLVQSGRMGAFPGGMNGLAFSLTSCNVGTGPIPWHEPMNADHPMIAFLVAREADGRLEQISGYSYVKHGFWSLNAGLCGACPGGPKTVLNVGCSDTYSQISNSDRYYLGAPDEIDPWLGEWEPVCSHFDRGDPAVAPPNDCNGIRSLTQSQVNALDPVKYRVNVRDADLNDPTATYFFQGQYVVNGEAESARGNNLGWRRMTPNWNGGANLWFFGMSSVLAHGSVLDAWAGATVASTSNVGFDGRVYVASLATQTGSCSHHYEYAFHNRDNASGVDVIRIPLAPGTVVSNYGFKDLDEVGANDWTMSVVGNELVLDGAGNPLPWNAIYNVWFDATAAPASGSVTLEQASLLPDMAVAGIETPTGPAAGGSIAYCTSGTSASGCIAVLSSSGIASASAPSGFVVSATAVEGSKDGQFYYGVNGRQAVPWGNGTSYRCVVPPTVRGGLQVASGTNGQCDGGFAQDMTALWTAVPGKNPGAGATTQLQLWYRDPQNTSNRTTSFSGGLEFTLCP